MNYFNDRVPTDTGITPRRDGPQIFTGRPDEPVYGGGSGSGFSNDGERGPGLNDDTGPWPFGD